jgi:WhiB family redox-sensing transcriptional regulator
LPLVALAELDPATTAYLMSGDTRELPTLAEMVARPAWMGFAACRGKATAIFFRGRGENTSPVARRLCAGCQVRPQCLDFAVADPELTGFWAGTSQRERRVMRRKAG